MALNQQQWDLVNFVEQEYLANGAIPTAERINYLGLASVAEFGEFLASKEVRDALYGRGIPLSHFSGTKSDVLTEEQLSAANVMLDLHDNRSQKKKLQDLGISSQKWQAWLRDPGFQNYMRSRAEAILGDNYHEANLALLDRIRSGDMVAVKFYYEVTGRYTPNRGDSVNLPALLMKIMEIIQKHVHDPETAGAIADEFITLASGVGVGLNSRQPAAIEGKVINL